MRIALAAGMAPPVGSVTVPRTVAATVWASAGAAQATTRAAPTARHWNRRVGWTIQLSDPVAALQPLGCPPVIPRDRARDTGGPKKRAGAWRSAGPRG